MTDYEYPAEQCEDCEHYRDTPYGEVCALSHELFKCSQLNRGNNCAVFKLWEGPKTVRRDET